jgi:hypothetical protein
MTTQSIDFENPDRWFPSKTFPNNRYATCAGCGEEIGKGEISAFFRWRRNGVGRLAHLEHGHLLPIPEEVDQ